MAVRLANIQICDSKTFSKLFLALEEQKYLSERTLAALATYQNQKRVSCEMAVLKRTALVSVPKKFDTWISICKWIQFSIEFKS